MKTMSRTEKTRRRKNGGEKKGGERGRESTKAADRDDRASIVGDRDARKREGESMGRGRGAHRV
jgi:hypothetical protein